MFTYRLLPFSSQTPAMLTSHHLSLCAFFYLYLQDLFSLRSIFLFGACDRLILFVSGAIDQSSITLEPSLFLYHFIMK